MVQGNFEDTLQKMLDRFNWKQNLHKRTHCSYKNRDIKMFTIPLMVVQLVNSILPQITQLHEDLEDILNVVMSSLAALSAIWMGFRAKKKYAELSESHKNAAAIYHHLAVLTMVEMKNVRMLDDYNVESFFLFQDTVQNLEGKAKDDEFLIPTRIVKERLKEKEQEKEKENLKKNISNVKSEDLGIKLPALPAFTDGKVSTSDNYQKPSF